MIRRLISMSVLVALLLSLTPVSHSTSGSVTQSAQSPQNVDQRSWLAGLQAYAALGNWLISKLPGRAKREPEMTVAPPVAAYLDPAPLFLDAPTNLTVTSTSDIQVELSWTAPAGAVDHYQVERSQNISGPFVFVSNAAGASFSDGTVTSDHAYLYRVRAVTSAGAVSLPSNMALGTATSFEFSSLSGQLIKAQHFYDVRTAINAVRALANLPATTWSPRQTLNGLLVEANDVQEMRNKLDEALTALSVNMTSYEDPTLSTGATGTLIKAIHLEQLQARSTRGSSNSSGPLDSDSATARVDPMNATGGGGENPLSRNFNWILPLVSLPGRAGMDLGLTLSYNSLVWTKAGNTISFDKDNGFPGPGFRLGFPVIQQAYVNSQVQKNAYLLIMPDGRHVELRQVNSSEFYEAADSSHLLLNSATMILRTTDGTQMSYVWKGSEFKCTKITDRNGNYINAAYTASGQLTTITDTLGRVLTFNYTAGLLSSISQVWNAGVPNQPPHYWARFEYSDTPIDYNFGSLTVFGLADLLPLRTLLRVKLPDDSYFEFNHTSWGQVSKISNFGADDEPINYRSYNLPETADPQVPYDDCPRFTSRKDWAKYWNGDTNGTISSTEEVATATFIVPESDTWTMPAGYPPPLTRSGMRAQVTAADGTSNKIYYLGTPTSSGWHRGLVALVDTFNGGPDPIRRVMTTWTQDDTTVSYPLNPRVTEKNVYDDAGNRARTETTYQQISLPNGMSCHLPQDVYEYAADASTKLRTTRTTYQTDPVYLDRRILGLVSEKQVYQGGATGALKSRVAFTYDGSGSIDAEVAAIQHEPSYGLGHVAGRANVSAITRFDVTNTEQPTSSTRKYNTAGSVVSVKDASLHEIKTSYVDSFSDGTPRDTFAYATTITDADNYPSTIKYNFDFGAVTYRRTPQPNNAVYSPGPEEFYEFDAIGRLQKISNSVNGAYTRYQYSTTPGRVDTFKTIQQNQGEAQSFEITDGFGRVVGRATDHPDSENHFSGHRMIYDVMGRLFKTSNPTETSAGEHPPLWDAVGDDSSWIFTAQTYDWNGRPLITTNPSLTANPAQTTTKIISYVGCGCAGGEVVTMTDEVGRKQKAYSDILGRSFKTEILNWDGSIYSTNVKTYDVRDQVTEIKEYAGTEGSPTFQVTTMDYDGFGRLSRKHVPAQQSGTETIWTYNADDTVSSITDARSASQTFAYNGRHLLTSIIYSPGNSGVPNTATVNISYDGAGNRLSMSDGFGTKSYDYDLLSRLTHETRGFSVGTFGISYSYNLAGQLNSITDPFGDSIAYTRNVQGQLKAVAGTPYAGTTSYITDVTYRAWGAPKSVNYLGSNSTIAYNGRLKPREFRLTGNTGSSIIRENYSYYADGRLATLTDLDDTAGTNPPATLRFLSRAYNYDHAGRVTAGFGNGSGGGGIPYNQSYGYDAFGNMVSRSGVYYSYNNGGFTSDTSTYVNNRRTNWNYNFEGQVTSTPLTSTDRPRNMSYDAAGRMLTSTEFGEFNTTTYTAGYDGDGQMVFESSVTSPGTSTSSYIVRSTVLGGEVLTRLDQAGNKKITHVPAEGLLFATQRSSGAPGPFVMATTRNPLGISETSKAVYDPLGNYIPFQAFSDPRPPAGSFNSGSMSGLSSSQANPGGYAVGCVMDGIPTDCNRVIRFLDRLPVKDFKIDGIVTTPWLILLKAGVTRMETYKAGELIKVEYAIAPGMQRQFEQNPANLRPGTQSKDQIKSFMDQILEFLKANPNCEAGLNSILAELKNVTGFDGGTVRDIIDRFRNDGILEVSPGVNESSSVGVGHGGIPRIGFSQTANTPNAEQNRRNTFVTMIGEMFHWAGMIGHLGPEYPNESALPDLSGRGFTNYFPDAAIATAANNLGLAMTVEQYRRTYPEKVATDTKNYGSDFAESTLAHGGISNACSKEKNRLMPEFAKP